MSKIFCGNSDCCAYLGSMGADSCVHCGWIDPAAIEAAATEALLQRIADLEQRNSDLHEDVQRFKKHALNEKAARMELERQLEAEPVGRVAWAADVPNTIKEIRWSKLAPPVDTLLYTLMEIK